MVETTMTDSELTKEIGVWAYQFVAKYKRSYPKAFVGIDVNDVKQELWIAALKAMGKYDYLPDESKIHSMRAYVKRACLNRLVDFRERELFKVERTKAEAATGISEQEMVQVMSRIARQKADHRRPLTRIQRLRFKNVQNAMGWYAQYLATDWYASGNGLEAQSFDDAICIAVDIASSLERNFDDRERSLLLKVGMDGFEGTLRQMNEPKVGNKRRYLDALVDKIYRHLRRKGYMSCRYYQRMDAA